MRGANGGTHRFRYRAARADGAIERGVIAAGDSAVASATLRGRGLFVLDVKESRGVRQTATPPRQDLAIAFRSLSSLVNAGVPVERALGFAASTARHAGLREVLEGARLRLREGDALGTALRSMTSTIPDSVIGVVTAGERGSQLGDALEECAELLELEAELVSSLRSALAYPVLIGIIGLVSITLITVFVVPRFAVLIGDLGGDLPVTTKLLLATAGQARANWGWGLMLMAAATIGLVSWLRTPRGRYLWHESLLKVPVVAGIRMQLATARVCRSLGGMLRTGMPVLAAVDALRGTAGDDAIGARLAAVRTRVARGARISDSLEAERAVTTGAVQLLEIGEANGQLGTMAARAGDHAFQEAERTLRALVSVLEPGLIVALGGAVAFVAAALLQAVYGVRPGGI